jgi:UPF0271 protein
LSKIVNLNADLGESFGAWAMGSDREILQSVASANVACGFHAGDPLVMRNTLRLAKAAGVSVGAHPSFPDRQGFGRRRMQLDPAELEALLIYQIAALDGMARTEGMRIGHVKAHGALSNMACADLALARTVAAAVKAYDPTLILLAPALSCLCTAGREAGLAVVEEIFADRAYLDDGQLVPRGRADAMIHGAARSLAHVEAMLEAQALITVGRKRLPTAIGSICVHGDSPDAVATAAHLRTELVRKGYQVRSLGSL